MEEVAEDRGRTLEGNDERIALKLLFMGEALVDLVVVIAVVIKKNCMFKVVLVFTTESSFLGVHFQY